MRPACSVNRTIHLTAVGVFFLMISVMLAEVPKSSRSRKAVRENLPRLEQEMDSLGFSIGEPVFIRIFKKTKELELWIDQGDTFGLFRIYDICYFSGGPGPKNNMGDNQAPEGFYYVPHSMMHPTSSFHLAFNIGYPNNYDQQHGCTGSALMVHGNCVSIGCYAMTDPIIDEIWTIIEKALDGGQPFFRVHILPFKDMATRLEAEKDSEWYDFWTNLEEGYRWFEEKRVPPDVYVKNKKYGFRKSAR